MPYDIAKAFDGCPYAVVKLTPDGRELAPGGCHQTAIEAGKHLAALQAATDYERGELRHPGAHDQAVHNPNKGASLSSKMMTPEKLAADRARTKDEMDRLADGATPADRAEAMGEYDAAEAAAVKFEQHSTATSGLFKSESDIGGAAGEAAVKTSKTLAKGYLAIKNRINRKASTARKEGNHNRAKAFRIAADGASRLEFSSGLSGFLSSVRGMAVILEMELRAEGYQPTGAMKAEARRGLEWRAEFNRGGTEIGVARARDIMNGRNLSLDTVRRMVSYFARHEVDKQGEGWSQGEPGYPSAGRIAWALWGGNPGRTWANAISESEDKDRAIESDQELRHPGHGDQSTHNPHKGGGWTPGGLKLQPKKTKAEWKAEILANDPAKLTTRADRLAGFAVAKDKNIDTYKNGDVTIEVSKANKFGRPVAPIDPKELEVMDKTAGAIVAKYPGELTVKYHAIDEPGVFGKAELGSREFTISPLAQSSAPMKVLGNDAGNLLEYTMWHEAGHAIQMKGQKPGFQYVSESLGIIETAQGNVASRMPNVGLGFQPGKQNIDLSLTSYAGESKLEWHAEAFAIHNLKVPVGAFTKSVVSEYAKEMDWAD